MSTTTIELYSFLLQRSWRSVIGFHDRTTDAHYILTWRGAVTPWAELGLAIAQVTVALGVRNAQGEWLCREHQEFSHELGRILIHLRHARDQAQAQGLMPGGYS